MRLILIKSCFLWLSSHKKHTVREPENGADVFGCDDCTHLSKQKTER